MKNYFAALLTIFAIYYHFAPSLRAQDGYLFSAQPPLVVRLGAIDKMIYFTNTSDNVIHGITVNHADEKGDKTAKVIIDTIDAHKTVSIEFVMAAELLLDGSFVTCTHYSKPLPVKLNLQ